MAIFVWVLSKTGLYDNFRIYLLPSNLSSLNLPAHHNSIFLHKTPLPPWYDFQGWNHSYGSPFLLYLSLFSKNQLLCRIDIDLPSSSVCVFLPPCVFTLCLYWFSISSLPLEIQPTYHNLAQRLPLSWSLPLPLHLYLTGTLVQFIERSCFAHNFSYVLYFLNCRKNFLCTSYCAWYNAMHILGPQLYGEQMIQ